MYLLCNFEIYVIIWGFMFNTWLIYLWFKISEMTLFLAMVTRYRSWLVPVWLIMPRINVVSTVPGAESVVRQLLCEPVVAVSCQGKRHISKITKIYYSIVFVLIRSWLLFMWDTKLMLTKFTLTSLALKTLSIYK